MNSYQSQGFLAGSSAENKLTWFYYFIQPISSAQEIHSHFYTAFGGNWSFKVLMKIRTRTTHISRSYYITSIKWEKAAEMSFTDWHEETEKSGIVKSVQFIETTNKHILKKVFATDLYCCMQDITGRSIDKRSLLYVISRPKWILLPFSL